eukprot:COSAG05_NODE_2711_length_2740_cov_1.705793_3_plen_182_part_00
MAPGRGDGGVCVGGWCATHRNCSDITYIVASMGLDFSPEWIRAVWRGMHFHPTPLYPQEPRKLLLPQEFTPFCCAAITFSPEQLAPIRSASGSAVVHRWGSDAPDLTRGAAERVGVPPHTMSENVCVSSHLTQVLESSMYSIGPISLFFACPSLAIRTHPPHIPPTLSAPEIFTSFVRGSA